MKIMSLNVNRFSGMKDRDYTNPFTRLDECPKANEIIDFVKKILSEYPDGMVFLYEVPYWKGEVKDGNFRWVEERKLYQNFRNSFPLEQYEISSPGKKGYSCTLAIWNKNSGWKSQNNVLGKAIGYTNKYVELTSEKTDLCLMGIHAPDNFDFLEALEVYAETHINKKLIILGDFNIATNEWRAKERKEQMEKGIKVAECKDFFRRRKWLLETMPSIDYSDIVDPEIPTYFQKRTTVDHALVSPELKDKVTKPALVIPRDKLELSDHAVIIVTIDE